jgi:Raf kinase inhibitor-like YbhB/YbcL family protein
MHARMNLFFAAALMICLVTACGANDQKFADKATMSIQVTSAAFATGQPIPQKYTCDGEDVSPPLQWTNAPTDVKSFALITEDPDAPGGIWTHWVLYNLPATATALAESTPKSPELADGARQGQNDFRKTGYNGPCPPPGKAHRYFFKIYALDAALNLPPGATRRELLDAMNGHVLAQGQLMGTYQRL